MKPPLPPTPPAAFKLTTTQRRLWRLLELPDAAVAAGGIERVKRRSRDHAGPRGRVPLYTRHVYTRDYSLDRHVGGIYMNTGPSGVPLFNIYVFKKIG